MTEDPDAIRADIERTRAQLSTNVNTLTYEANPKTVVRRQVGKVRSAFGSARDKVMGSDDSSGLADAGGRAKDAVSDTASQVGEAISDAPQTVARQTQGSPLAAGLIAFGVGALIGGLIPASRAEAQVAQKAKEAAEPLQEQLTEAAKETAQSLQQPAQEAAQAVKETATDAVDAVKDEGSSAVDDVKSQAQDSADQVRNS